MSRFQISGARAKIRARVTVGQVTVGQNLIHPPEGRPVVGASQYSMQLQWPRGRRGARQYSMQLQWSIGDGEEVVESCCRRRASQRELKGCPPEADPILLF